MLTSSLKNFWKIIITWRQKNKSSFTAEDATKLLKEAQSTLSFSLCISVKP